MEKPKNQVIVIFGASGDLTYRKLIPALYALHNQQMLPERFRVLGIGRTVMSDEDFRKKMTDGIRAFSESNHLEEKQIAKFSGLLSYISMNQDNPDEYLRLKSVLEEMCTSCSTERNYLFYLALLPSMFGIIAKNLARVGLNDPSDGFKRLIIEKPFGYDLDSALSLNRDIHEAFSEDQLFRIDHYLGKETVQNLLVMRFSNGIFEPLWNRNYIHHVEISSCESMGVENRGRYYEGAGALRDMLQNHLLQMVGFTAMEPPSSMDADAIRNEIFKVFQSLKPIQEKEVPVQVIRGQYTASHMQGQAVRGYREEKDVDPNSLTETFVALKFYIDNWRWGGVPFYIRTGKRMPTNVTEIVVRFKSTPQTLFRGNYAGCNMLIIRIQPDEGILLKFGMKEPGAGFIVKTVNMKFHYSELSEIHLPSAYERLLYDAMLGDSTLFARADAVEAAWKFVAPIQKAWAGNLDQEVQGYPAGTLGPESANKLIEDFEEGWHYPCKNLADDGNYCEL